MKYLKEVKIDSKFIKVGEFTGMGLVTSISSTLEQDEMGWLGCKSNKAYI